MRYSLNSLKVGYIEDYVGEHGRLRNWDTGSSDYGLYSPMREHIL